MIWTGLACAAAVVAGIGWLREKRRAEQEKRALAEQAADERERLERAARESEEHFRAILASMAEGVVVVDRRRVIRLANPSIVSMFHLRQEPVGQSLLTTLRLPLLETMMRAAIEEGTAQQEEATAQLEPGQPPVHLIISTLPMGEGANVRGAVTVIGDISRLRRLEEMRREFVANVSHELRTPLSIFHGYLETLLDRP